VMTLNRERSLRTLGRAHAGTGWRVHAEVVMSSLATSVTQHTREQPVPCGCVVAWRPKAA
jgi:hypothetical protein